jgi:hypothetical protein
MYLSGTENGISSTAQIGQIWSRDAIKNKLAKATMLIVTIDPRASEKSIAQISTKSTWAKKEKEKHKENSETA